jgi:hypothetical protein
LDILADKGKELAVINAYVTPEALLYKASSVPKKENSKSLI